MFETHLPDVPQRALTGDLPAESTVEELLQAAHARYAPLGEGEVADYIPALAEADPALFGLALTEVDGTQHLAGDTSAPFTIQSISKAFVLALVLEAIGHEEVHRIVGVNNTGLPFNSVIALELNAGSPMNPMVNAGAIATTALMPGADAEQRWQGVHEGLSRFAGRSLEIDERVLRSESASNHRNRGIASLLASYERLRGDAPEMVEVYTRQCSLLVTAEDLAVMGATLADGGLNPVTGEQVVSAEVCRDTLAVLAACGMYELSGEWQFEIGLPAKSGVSGGIVAVAPGKGALGVFSPPLDRAGNSVRGQRACAHLARTLGLNLFASTTHARKGARTDG
ncbi:glutaminase A [Brachybacterium saurashtrense]|uniref:Glutaminase n=1 Tax=Brachybacterium saurashtrense TaxID=556288 RepID=A0A345YJY5_9MICO|nr:glutaminase A [Brachybacterium saurashtrense]AXK44237.1 glutaminase [Brachybacterium saurashtrense]RRR21509.1 glutaminase [Brachybacterium saurashtrense]